VTRSLAIRIRRLLWTPVRIEANRQVVRWRRGVEQARTTQAALLERILADAARTDFGADFQLASARTVDDLRARMPVAGYERAEPYIRRVARGDTAALFPPGTRLRMFAMTSGTTGRPKYIPITDQGLKAYREGWHVWGACALNDHFEAFGAHILQVSSRMDEEITPGGVPAGAISGLTAQSQRRIVRRFYVGPTASASARDTASKYYLLCRLGLECDRVMPITANPSTLLGLARAMDERKEDLLRDMADGTLADGLNLPNPVRRMVEKNLRPRPDRARELERVIRDTGHLYPRDVWDVPLIGTWTGGTLGLYLKEMPRYWGEAPVRDIGLIASEGRFSIPLATAGSAGVLEATATFYEFVPAHRMDDPDAETLLAHEVEIGRPYGLIITTPGGLFRYNMNDVVRVVDRLGDAPVIEFLNKGEHVANLTGEKLTEHQVTAAVNTCAGRLGLRLDGYCLCPAWGEVPGYSLLVEEDDVPPGAAPTLAAEVDAALRRSNIEYEAKRKSGRLKAIRVRILPAGTWEQYDRDLIARRHGRVEQYKHKFLVPEVDFEKQFRVLAEYAGPEAPRGGEPSARR